jgi:hypothetical protein
MKKISIWLQRHCKGIVMARVSKTYPIIPAPALLRVARKGMAKASFWCNFATPSLLAFWHGKQLQSKFGGFGAEVIS